MAASDKQFLSFLIEFSAISASLRRLKSAQLKIDLSGLKSFKKTRTFRQIYLTIVLHFVINFQDKSRACHVSNETYHVVKHRGWGGFIGNGVEEHLVSFKTHCQVRFQTKHDYPPKFLKHLPRFPKRMVGREDCLPSTFQEPPRLYQGSCPVWADEGHS